MTGQVLGRVLAPKDRPRGPDTQMSVTVPESFIAEGATLEIELPRNLACAPCGGGGCDACGRSGAVALRGRKDPPESVEVTLPKKAPSEEGVATHRAVMLRIPERGGVPLADADLPRGNLLLTIRAGESLTNGVTRLPGPSVPPPPVTPELVGVEAAEEEGSSLWLFVVAALAALAAWWLWR